MIPTEKEPEKGNLQFRADKAELPARTDFFINNVENRQELNENDSFKGQIRHPQIPYINLFVSRPLYLFSQFFEDKGIEELLGEEIKTDYINDDKIGRVMDELYKHGLNDIFIEVVLSVIKKFKIETKYSHLDATSFHLDGEYKSEEEKKKEEEEIIKERPIIITKGYSRDHRPDLK